MTSALVFDGDCAFCSTTARWLEVHAVSATRLVPWQHADLGALGLTAAACADALQWVDGAHRSAGPDAVADYLRTSTWGWRQVGRLLAVPVVRLVSWPAYRWVARNRHRLPGGTPACAMRPPPSA